MEILLDRFPVFEANQVLMSGHLNNVFDYLDQQTRLSRSHLIGIGVVCGLELRLDTTAHTISLGKGCGVTSEGYLIIEPDDVTLTSYRSYTLPVGEDYPALKNVTLWELFPAGESATTPLNSPAQFLDDKAVLLYLELKQQALRNCSPNNCDDKGSLVVATARRLLVSKLDLDRIIEVSQGLGDGLTSNDIASHLSARLDLPDIRQPRFDVVATNLVSSADIYQAFLRSFSDVRLAAATGTALSAAYNTLRPVLEKSFPTNPFAGFAAAYGFLDSLPQTREQVRFLQYYRDLFDDILLAYDEFRWEAVEYVCSCCPPRDLFPRHLMLGALLPATTATDIYRQRFLPSSAISACEDESKVLLSLFTRLVELTRRFTNGPGLIGGAAIANIDPQIRATPSVHGRGLLGLRAIPYYYQLNGHPPLYHLWDHTKYNRKRANQNLSYRSSEFAPPPPAFVSNPLRFDLEPNNFLRIEGHLNKNVASVLTTLKTVRDRNRLPFDVVALRTGAYDPLQPVDLSREKARFADLEALYDSLREKLLSNLGESTRQIYDIANAASGLQDGTPQNPLLRKYAPDFRYGANTLGGWYESHFSRFASANYIDVNQAAITSLTMSNIYRLLLASFAIAPAPQHQPFVVALYYFMKLAAVLPDSLDALIFSDFENRAQDLLALLRYFRSEEYKKNPADLQALLQREELIDLSEDVLLSCQIEPIASVHQAYVKRVDELRKLQFLSTFLQEHPGIEHKAGVPMGGTFILVYHSLPRPPQGNGAQIAGTVVFPTGIMTMTAGTISSAAAASSVAASQDTTASINNSATIALRGDTNTMMMASDPQLTLASAFARLVREQAIRANPDVQVMIDAMQMTQPQIAILAQATAAGGNVPQIIAETVAALADGAVIADFYLPYRLNPGGPSVDFVLPKPPPILTVSLGCTNDSGAVATISVTGGKAPYELAVDGQGFVAVTPTLLLTAGSHVLRARDSEGTETPAQTIVVPQAISIVANSFKCGNGEYTASLTVSGGTGPYMVNGEKTDGAYTSEPVKSETELTVEVTDHAYCSTTASFKYTCPPECNLPCGGQSQKRDYVFWMPHPQKSNPYKGIEVSKVRFIVAYDEAAPTKTIDLSSDFAAILKEQPADLSEAGFGKTVQGWLYKMNEVIRNTSELNGQGTDQWLKLEYVKSPIDGFGTLQIEHFSCLGFDISVAMRLDFEQSAEVNVEFSYKHDDAEASYGTEATYGTTKFAIPPMNGTTWNKCEPGKPELPLCPLKVDFKLEPTVAVGGKTISAKVSSSVGKFMYLWDAPQCNPRFGTGDQFIGDFITSENFEIYVKAIDENGCTDVKIIPV